MSVIFPPVVDTDLHLSGSATIEKAVAPPDGCLLCHLTEQGGLGTNNRFGLEMLHSGAVAEETATIAPALDAIQASDPLAISDIKMGINPNDDPKWLSGSTSTDPVPTYGCGSVSPAPPNGFGSGVALASIVAALIARGTFRRRRLQHWRVSKHRTMRGEFTGRREDGKIWGWLGRCHRL
jgi:hypothetical protein